MAFVVLYDANALYGNFPRDLLIRIARSRLVQAKWTHEILDEVFRNIKANRPELDPVKLDRTRELMITSIRDCLVQDYEPLIDALDLPDRQDRHVLAAAIKARAQVIVTDNLKDFPSESLSCWDIEAKNRDDFILDQISLNKTAVFRIVQDVAAQCTSPPLTTDDILDSLAEDGMIKSVEALRAH